MGLGYHTSFPQYHDFHLLTPCDKIIGKEFHLLFTDLTVQQMLKKGCLSRRFFIQAVIVTFLFGCVVMYYCPMVLKQLPFYKSPYKTDTINLSHLMKQVEYSI